MTPILRIFAVLCLVATAGCGHVAANYPVIHADTPKPLPQKFESRGEARRLVWREDGRLHGFYFNTKPAADTVEMLEGLAEQGVGRAVMDLPLIRPAAKEGLARVTLQVFVTRGYSREIRRGDLLVRFSDGSEAQDEGSILVPVIGTGEPAKSTRYGAVTLDGAGDEDMKGRSMIVFVPGGMSDLAVESVGFSEK